MSKIIVTSALPYAEGVPHLGNFVGSILPADVYYKYLFITGADAIYICGSDQHGTPIEVQAMKRGISPKELADAVHEQIKESAEKFGCTFTYYGKTDSEKNKDVVYEIFDALDKNGFIKQVEDIQPYCNVDKRFLADRFIEGICPYCKAEGARGDQCDNCGNLLNPSELINAHCVICGSTDIEFRKTSNLALDLKKLEPNIKEFVEKNKGNNWSRNAVNKTLSYISQGLKPRDITRDISWGFKVNKKGFEEKKFYVWFDAVIGYIGITSEWTARWKNYWMDKDTKLIQFMGKDNIEFHTMMWPGILIGSRMEFILPHTIKAYEYLNANGVKFSKSRGIGLNVQNALDIMPADYWRFALMHLLPETSDTEFSIASFIEIVNKIMNDKIGNLVHRVLTITKNNHALLGNKGADPKIVEKIDAMVKNYMSNFGQVNMRDALQSLVKLAELGNEMMSTKEPWKMLKNADEKSVAEFSSLMNGLLDIVYALGIMLYPFTPNASKKILSYFGAGESEMKGMMGRIASRPDLMMDIPITTIFNKVSETELKKMEKYSGGESST